jgi:DNA-binding CsgD family transcriptional regulator
MTTRTWLLRWWAQGRTVQQIADLVGERTGEIRVMLRRAGKKVPPK